MPNAIDYSGKKYHRLTAIAFTGRYTQTSGGNKRRIWTWQCDCGTTKDIPAEKVIRGDTKSCGCAKGKYTGDMALAGDIFNREYRDGDLTRETFYKLSKLDCYYCGAKPSNCYTGNRKTIPPYIYNGLDRKDNSLPHTLANCVPCCWRCNEAKKSFHHDDFLTWIRQIYNHKQLQENHG